MLYIHDIHVRIISRNFWFSSSKKLSTYNVLPSLILVEPSGNGFLLPLVCQEDGVYKKAALNCSAVQLFL